MEPIHLSTDCGFLFAMERENDPLRILQDGEEKAVFLPSGNCSIDASTSQYLDCGIWHPIDDMSVFNKFSLHRRFTDSYSFKASTSISLSIFTVYFYAEKKLR